MNNIKLTIPLFFLLISMPLCGQERITQDKNAMESIDKIVKEMLRIISGEEGKIRNWDDYRNLFLPTVRFTILNQGDSITKPYDSVSLEEFIESFSNRYLHRGFLEYETGKVVDEYNGLAQVFQSFYAKDSDGEAVRGITSYQLINFEGRWWIANVVWTVDSNGVEVPEKYLENKN